MLTSVKRLLAVIFSVFFVFLALPAVADTSDIKETYIVKFNANGGNCPKCSTSQVKLTYGKLGPKIDVGKPTRTNRIFVGWYDGPDVTNATKYYDTNGVSVRAWDKRGDTTLYAVYTATPVFWVTTTQLSANTTVSFQITATGTFTVDWGDGNVETKVSYFQTVCRLPDEQPSPAYTGSGTPPCYATPQTFSHTYTTAGTYTIGIGSENAGNYRIHGLYTTYEEILGADLYYMSHYFHKINRPVIYFGYDTYGTSIDRVCTWVKGISGSLGALFPSNSSGHPTGTPSFWTTFEQCTNLQGTIPNNLFSGLSGSAKESMFSSTFRNTRFSGSIPVGLFSGIFGAPQHQMFASTFSGNEYLSGTIPQGLFSGIQGDITNKTSVFNHTFAGTSRLNCSIPENLFTNFNGTASTGQFAGTFNGFCSYGTRNFIPPKLFEGDKITIRPGGSNPGMHSIFLNSGLYQTCPDGYRNYITGFESYWSGRVACEGAEYTVTLDDNGGHGGEGALIEHYTVGWKRPANPSVYINNFAVPSRASGTFGVNYAFRGYYKYIVEDVNSNTGVTPGRIFPANGVVPAPTVTRNDVTYYAAWAQTCRPGANALCELIIAPNGAVTYETSCQPGYTLRPGTGGTYSPQCDAAPYTITLNKNGGSGGTNGPIYVKYGVGYYANMSGGNVSNPITSIQVPTKSGYTFAGYYHETNANQQSNTDDKSADGSRASTIIIDASGNIVAANTYFSASATIVAKWEPRIYTITLNHNNATTAGAPNVVYYKYGVGIYRNAAATQPMTRLTRNPVRTGYVFSGYRAPYEPQRDGTKEGGRADGLLIVDATGKFTNYLRLQPKNYTITAEWAREVYPIVLDDTVADTAGVPNQFYLKYGEGFYSDVAATQPITNLTTLPTRAGYTFAGYRSPNETLVVTSTGRIIANNVFTSAPVTITSRWTPNIYRIYMDHNGADTVGTPGIVYLKYGVGFFRYPSAPESSQITQMDVLPIKTGYIFNGYKTQNMATNIISNTGEFLNNTTFTTQNTTIVADWEPTCNEIDLVLNGGTAGVYTKLYKLSGLSGWYVNSWCRQRYIPTTMIVPTRPGYTFRGFHTASYSDVSANNSSPLTSVLTTVGEIGPYGQTGGATTNTAIYAAWARNCVNPVENGSCALDVEPEGITTYETICDTNYNLTSGANTYNPICTAARFNVTYSCGDGGGTPPSPGTAYYAQDFTSAINTCTKSGYDFAGWLVSGTTDVQQAGETFVWFYETNKVFTAQWVPAPYLCKPGWYLQANTTECRLCPAGKYCIGGSFYFNATQDQGITGDVAAGYYSIAGADTPQGNGLVFAGHFSTGGATIRRPMGENDGCLSGYNCGKLSAPYYSGGGSIDDGPLCREGNVCGACDINYRDNTMTGKTVITQCQAVCAVGKCVHEAYAACANAGITNWASDGPVSYGDTSCNVCPVGTFTSGTGFGANEPGDCGRSLRIGAYTLYLRSEKKTPFALHVKIDDTVYYGNVHQKTSGISGVINMSHNNQTYVICDETGNMCQGIDL